MNPFGHFNDLYQYNYSKIIIQYSNKYMAWGHIGMDGVFVGKATINKKLFDGFFSGPPYLSKNNEYFDLVTTVSVVK